MVKRIELPGHRPRVEEYRRSLNRLSRPLANNEDPLRVTVVTVSFNAHRTIRQTIESVLQQSYNNIEYIIIDALSNDGTAEIINEYRDDPRVFALFERDRGIYDAMNKGISIATGDFIVLLNADDYFEPNAISEVMSQCESLDRSSILFTDSVLVFDDLNFAAKRTARIDFKKGMQTLSHQAVFVPQHHYEKLGLYRIDLKLAADFELLYYFEKMGVAFKAIRKPLVNVRYGGLSDANFRLSRQEAASVIRVYEGFQACAFYRAGVLKSFCMRYLHKISRFLFGESAYLWVKRQYAEKLAEKNYGY